MRPVNKRGERGRLTNVTTATRARLKTMRMRWICSVTHLLFAKQNHARPNKLEGSGGQVSMHQSSDRLRVPRNKPDNGTGMPFRTCLASLQQLLSRFPRGRVLGSCRCPQCQSMGPRENVLRMLSI